MRLPLLLALALIPACASAKVAAPVVPTHVELSAGSPELVSGFRGEKALNGVPDEPEQLRGTPRYEKLVAGLVGKIDARISCDDYLDVERELLARLEASGDFSGGNGPLALEIIRLSVAADAAKLAPHRGRALAYARERGVQLEPGTSVVTQRADPKLEVHGFGKVGEHDLALPVWSRVTGADRSETDYTYLTEAQAHGVSAFFDLARRFQEQTIDVEGVAKLLQANDLEWENYLQRGYPQFPWENLANGWLVSSSWDRPPTEQFVILHPEVGFVLDLGDSRTASIDAALLVHVLGYVHYFGDEDGWYLGASATGAVSADEDVGLGYGCTFHFGTTSPGGLLPHMDVGVLWHDGASDDGVLLSIGVDLLRLLGPSAR